MSGELPGGLLDFLRELVRIPSLSGTPEEVRCAERIAAEMRACGLDEAWTDAFGNAVGVLYGQRQEAPGWILLTHLDVVSAGDEAAWTHPPFGAVTENGVLYGRGSVDIKGALASQLYALKALGEHRPLGDIVLCVAAQEEIDGAGAAGFFAHLPLVTPAGRTVNLGACLVGEPSRNRLMLGHRGILRLVLRFKGKAHHAAAADHAANPHFALATFLERVRRHPVSVHPVLGPDTLAPTVIISDSASQNVTPGVISLVLDWRYAEKHPSSFERQLRELTAGLDVVYALPPAWSRGPEDAALGGPAWVNTPGFLTEPGHPLVELAQSCLPASMPPSVWSFATDGRYSARCGLPTVGCGPGDERLIHTAGEALDLGQLPPYLAFLDRLLRTPLPVSTDHPIGSGAG